MPSEVYEFDMIDMETDSGVSDVAVEGPNTVRNIIRNFNISLSSV